MKINQSKNDEANWFAILLLVNFLTVTFWIVSQNVDVSNTEVAGNDSDATQFGEQLAAAIQAEIITQKRSGGLLS